jgi:EAL domain-containing protein (putative c-di-GMP-specific phosphodiesterase class I)
MIGDQVLVKVRDIVRNILRDDERFYHVGADNFAILKTNVESSDDIIETVQKIFKLFENPLSVVSNMLAIKVKAGIYNFEHQEFERGDFSEYAINNAQLALRKAKESRQLTFATYDISIGQVINREMVMVNDLKEALNNKEMVMYYQPQYDASKKKIFSFEALMKWTNPKYINESAEKFIRLAEQNGLIIPLGQFVIEEAFKVAKRLENENIKVSINISPVQMLQSGFIRDIASAARRININPKQISLEITETFMIESFNEVIDKLKLLRDLGFSIHLDDFGTGFSSLLYLKELPITTIKIDKEFIKPIVYDQYSKSIVKHIIDLAKSLDLNVIAEGVETEEQKQIILNSGCQYIQGYLISKAVPEAQIDQLLELHNKK